MVDSPWLAFAPWGRALVKLGNSLPWFPSSHGQTSTLFHFFSCFSQLAFCSNLQWGFKTIHIHRAPNLKEERKVKFLKIIKISNVIKLNCLNLLKFKNVIYIILKILNYLNYQVNYKQFQNRPKSVIFITQFSLM